MLFLAALWTATPAQADFKIDVGGLLSGHALTPVIALPAQRLVAAVSGNDISAAFSSEVGIDIAGERSFRLAAPSVPGSYPVHMTSTSGATKSLQLLVAQPFDHADHDHIDGYRIGHYPSQSRAPRPGFYAPPSGLIRVDRQDVRVPISEHFEVGQFLCKQSAGWPRFLALQPALVLQLENAIERLASKGVNANTLAVLSGYRTPAYNASLGNVRYSRHVYGDAADVYVDTDGDGFMDDLNGDGVVSVADARELARLLASLPGADYTGIGVYPATNHHGPFVHVDMRGFKARWGSW
ncbi:MAG: D-Ala-D-Ala carboxypeptidase family metallohydrolase [Pseudomonadota bacterium]